MKSKKGRMEIKPGFELDQAVAEAIGCRVRGHRKGGYWCGCNKAMTLHGTGTKGRMGDPPPRLHYYSTDLNAAFAAAEKVGLLINDGPSGHCLYSSHTHQDLIGDPVRTWFVGIVNAKEEIDGHCVTAATAALAICAAILTLKETTVTTEKE